MKIKLYFYLLLFLMVFSGCSNVNTGVTNPETGYPIDISSPTIPTPYPAPSMTDPENSKAVIQPTQDSSLASLTGYLLIEKNGIASPVSNAILYLAPVLKDDQGIERVVSFDRFSSNKAITDEYGKFTFVNVGFNKYGIILDRILNTYLLGDPQLSSDMLFTIEESKVYDVGELRYEFLPEN